MKLIFLLIISFLFSCSNHEGKFNKERWNSEEDRGYFEYRSQMLEDLLKNQKLKGKTVEELKKLFGNLENYDTLKNTITFTVLQEWSGIDPVYTKYLVLKLDFNKKVKYISFEEFKR
jgi:hypothetical protein